VQLLATFEGQEAVNHLAFSPDGKILAASDQDRALWLWDVSKRRPRATLDDHFIDTTHLVFTPDGKRLAVASGAESLKIFDIGKARKVLDLEDRSGGLRGVAFSPDGKNMATGGMRPGSLNSLTGVVRWRETKEGAVDRSLTVKEGPVMFVDFSPDGKTLALALGDHWAVSKAMLSEDAEVAAALLGISSRPYRLTGKPRGFLKLVDLNTGKAIKSKTAHEYSADVVKFSPDGRTLATGGGDGVVKLWDVATWKEQFQLKGHGRAITSLAFSPDGKFLAGADDGSVKIWDVASGKELPDASKRIKGGSAVAFAPQGCILATGSQWKPIKAPLPPLLKADRRDPAEDRVIRLWKLEAVESQKTR
jgi:WD40 repeat protein